MPSKKTLIGSVVAFGALMLIVCVSTTHIESTHNEQRVVELPANDPNSTLDVAAKIGRGLIANGLATDIQKEFPTLTPKQLQGVFLTWNVGAFKAGKRVFFLTGIRHPDALPQAAAVADYCKSRVEKAVAEKFPAAHSK